MRNSNATGHSRSGGLRRSAFGAFEPDIGVATIQGMSSQTYQAASHGSGPRGAKTVSGPGYEFGRRASNLGIGQRAEARRVPFILYILVSITRDLLNRCSIVEMESMHGNSNAPRGNGGRGLLRARKERKCQTCDHRRRGNTDSCYC